MLKPRRCWGLKGRRKGVGRGGAQVGPGSLRKQRGGRVCVCSCVRARVHMLWGAGGALKCDGRWGEEFRSKWGNGEQWRPGGRVAGSGSIDVVGRSAVAGAESVVPRGKERGLEEVRGVKG